MQFLNNVLQGPTLQPQHLHHGDKVPPKDLEESVLETLEYLPHPAMFTVPVFFPGKLSPPLKKRSTHMVGKPVPAVPLPPSGACVS